MPVYYVRYFFFQAEDGIRDTSVTGVQTCALPIYRGCAILDACAAASLGVGAARLGGAVGGNPRRPLHHRQRAAAARRRGLGPVARVPHHQAKIASYERTPIAAPPCPFYGLSTRHPEALGR